MEEKINSCFNFGKAGKDDRENSTQGPKYFDVFLSPNGIMFTSELSICLDILIKRKLYPSLDAFSCRFFCVVLTLLSHNAMQITAYSGKE